MITGEKLQSLAEVSFYSELNCILEEQRVKTNLQRIGDVTTEQVKSFSTIFVYTHFLPNFFNTYFDSLKEGVTLITHNSDHCIDKSFLKYLECNTIKSWYCQNRLVSHPKLFSIPIGIANSQWPHGDLDTLAQIKEQRHQKENFVFKNFDTTTNKSERELCDSITTKNGISMSPKTDNYQYWETIAKSKFVISPPGNGVDCHRIWECLYLGSIPVVLEHEALSQFSDLPILFVKSWEDVTISFLEKVTLEIPEKIDILDIEYWKEKIST